MKSNEREEPRDILALQAPGGEGDDEDDDDGDRDDGVMGSHVNSVHKGEKGLTFRTL